jgi:farnesyl-diphosphate farnesyltransferase
MIEYSKRNLKYATQYMEALKEGSAARTFCEIPYSLAVATVHIIETGGQKLTRQQVM